MNNTKHGELSLEMLQAIKRRLKAKSWVQTSHTFQEFIFTEFENLEYCDTVVKCVQRTFKPLGWELELRKYEAINCSNRKRYCYTWMLTKIFEKK